MEKEIFLSVKDAVRASEKLLEKKSLEFIETASLWISDCFLQGGKILIAGNGGSLCDAMHFAEELTGQFRKKRKALAAIAFSDPGHMSCVSNDMGFEYVFSRAVEAYGNPQDIFIALTTSGNSLNLNYAIQTAKQMQLKTIAFLGKTGGKLKGIANLEWIVDGFETSDRIQEAHMAAIHIIIEMVENNFFGLKTDVMRQEQKIK